MQEAAHMSSEIRSGGRAAEIHTHRLRDIHHHQHTLQQIIPELRLLAEHRGQETLNVFDALVKPWVANAMGCTLTELKYDCNLSQMHIVSLPAVHGGAVTNKLYVNPNLKNNSFENGGAHAEAPGHLGLSHVQVASKAVISEGNGGDALLEIQANLKAIREQLTNLERNKDLEKSEKKILC